MAKINFTQNEGVWLSEEFSVNNNFNLHVERRDNKLFILQQKSAGSQFADVRESSNYSTAVVDIDVEVLVAPKTYRIVSYSEVTNAEYTEGA